MKYDYLEQHQKYKINFTLATYEVHLLKPALRVLFKY